MKQELRLRLIRLRMAIDYSLEHDFISNDLFPRLFSVYRYMWGKNVDDLVNHNLKR